MPRLKQPDNNLFEMSTGDVCYTVHVAKPGRAATTSFLVLVYIPNEIKTISRQI